MCEAWDRQLCKRFLSPVTVNDEQFKLDFVVRTFPAAIVHTLESASDALRL